MPKIRKKLSLLARLKARFFAIVAYFKARWQEALAQQLVADLADPTSKVRTEAERALERVVFETDIAPDCVQCCIVRGGCSVMIKHDNAWEAFVHNSYTEAADKAIEWLKLQGDEVSTKQTSDMNRKERRSFDVQRRQKRRGWKGVVGGGKVE